MEVSAELDLGVRPSSILSAMRVHLCLWTVLGGPGNIISAFHGSLHSVLKAFS